MNTVFNSWSLTLTTTATYIVDYLIFSLILKNIKDDIDHEMRLKFLRNLRRRQQYRLKRETLRYKLNKKLEGVRKWISMNIRK